MDDFKELEDQASRITYEDGTSVTMNWSENTYCELAPMSLSIERGHETLAYQSVSC